MAPINAPLTFLIPDAAEAETRREVPTLLL